MKYKILLILGFWMLSFSIYGQQQPVYRDSFFLHKSKNLNSSDINQSNIPSYKLTPEWQKHKYFQALGWTTNPNPSKMAYPPRDIRRDLFLRDRDNHDK